MAEELKEGELIKKYLKGDQKALEILIAQYLKLIYSFVYKNVGSQSDAEDITQEVFVKVWKNLRKFDQTKNFKPWIFQIAKNTSIDFLRKKKSIPFSRFENEKGQNMLVDNIEAPSDHLIEKLSDEKTIESGMQVLSENEQELVNLRNNEGMSFKQIAGKFKESVNTVKSRYRRSLMNLRKNIKK